MRPQMILNYNPKMLVLDLEEWLGQLTRLITLSHHHIMVTIPHILGSVQYTYITFKFLNITVH